MVGGHCVAVPMSLMQCRWGKKASRSNENHRGTDSRDPQSVFRGAEEPFAQPIMASVLLPPSRLGRGQGYQLVCHCVHCTRVRSQPSIQVP